MDLHDVNLLIQEVFEDINQSLPAIEIKPYSTTPTKLGLRFGGTKVILTYNSYKQGWLDTSAALGPKLRWFKFRPTPNKPDQYWAVQLTPEEVRRIYREHRDEILAVLRAAWDLPATALIPKNPTASVSEESVPVPIVAAATSCAATPTPESVRQCFASIFKCPCYAQCRTRFEALDGEFQPQPGFIGKRYFEAKCRVVIVAQNPGHASISSHTPDEQHMYALWQSVANTQGAADFDTTMDFIGGFMKTWPIIQRARLQENYSVALEDIAYLNVLKCKTKENQRPSNEIYQTCLEQTTRKQLQALAPHYLLCFGKDTYTQIAPLAGQLRIRCNWILHPSGTYANVHPDEQAVRVKEVGIELGRLRQ